MLIMMTMMIAMNVVERKTNVHTPCIQPDIFA